MAEINELHITTTTGIRRPATPEEILEAARRVLSHRLRRGVTLDSPSATQRYLSVKFGGHEYEVFTVLMLDLCVADSYVELKLNAQQIEHCAGLCST